MTVLIVAPVVFQPGTPPCSGTAWPRQILYFFPRSGVDAVIDHVVEATMIMAKNKVGALIVFERTVGLDDRIDTGIRLEALVSKSFLEIFLS